MSLETIAGRETYAVWVDMLRRLVPEGRTHRLAPLIAGMLRYALDVAIDLELTRKPHHPGAAVARVLVDAGDADEPADAAVLVTSLLERLFADAQVDYGRISSRGKAYSLIDAIAEEYFYWYAMPWEV